MKALRIILGILAVIPIGLLTYHLAFLPIGYVEDGLATLAYFVFGIPILIFNIWVWGVPNAIEAFLFGKAKKTE